MLNWAPRIEMHVWGLVFARHHTTLQQLVAERHKRTSPFFALNFKIKLKTHMYRNVLYALFDVSVASYYDFV